MRFPPSSVSVPAHRVPYQLKAHTSRLVSFAGSKSKHRGYQRVDRPLTIFPPAPNFFNIVAEMREPADFTKAMLCCQTVVTSTYLVSAMIRSLKFLHPDFKCCYRSLVVSFTIT